MTPDYPLLPPPPQPMPAVQAPVRYDPTAGRIVPEAEPLFAPSERELGGGVTRRDVLRVILKHRRMILVAWIAVTLIVAGGILLFPPTYKAETRILVNMDVQGAPAFFTGVAAVSDGREPQGPARRLETEMELLASTPMAERVVRDLGLAWDDVFHPPLTYILGPAMDAYEWTKVKVFGFAPHDRKDFRSTVEGLQKGLKIAPAESRSAEVTADVIVVQLKAPTARAAQQSLARLVDEYVAFRTKLNSDAAVKALAILEQEESAAAGRVREAQAALRTFLAGHGAGAATVRTDVSDGGDPALALAPLSSPRDEETLQRLKLRLVEKESELIEARQLYRPGMPQLAQLQREIAALRSKIDLEVSATATNFASLNELTRDLRQAETRLTELQRKRGEVSLYVQVNESAVGSRVVIDPALQPSASDWKKRALMGIIGSVVGLLLGLTLAGLAEYLDQRLGTKEDVRRFVGLDVLAAVPSAPRLALRGTLVLKPRAHEARGPAARVVPTMQALAARVVSSFPDWAGPGSPGHSVLVTSASDGEGKTTIASALAVQLARIGYGRVLLVDANLAGPRVHTQFGVPNERGFRELLVRGGWEEVTPTRGALSMLSAGSAGDEALLLNGAVVNRFLQEAGERFDWIVFDGASLAGGTMNRLAQAVDGMVLVVDAQRTRRQAVRDVLRNRLLTRHGREGVVLNNARLDIPDYLYERM